jgi:hypothetical protein
MCLTTGSGILIPGYDELIITRARRAWVLNHTRLGIPISSLLCWVGPFLRTPVTPWHYRLRFIVIPRPQLLRSVALCRPRAEMYAHCHCRDWRRSLDAQLCRKSYSRVLSAHGAAYVITGTGAALMRLARIQVLTEAVIGFRVIQRA